MSQMEALSAAIVDAVASVQETPAPAEQGDWTLGPRESLLVAAMLQRLSRKSVLEFGAGRSSLVIGKALDRAGGGRLTSIDHAPEYLGDAWEQVRGMSSIDSALLIAPLVRTLTDRGLLCSYEGIEPKIRDRGPFDFVLIDAPPGQRGRDAALHLAFESLASGCVIALDDAPRFREQTAIRRWLSWYPGLTLVQSPEQTGSRLAILAFDGSREVRFSARAFVGTLDDWRRGL